MKAVLMAVGLSLVATTLHADPLTCDLTDYRAASGLTATMADDTLAVTWEGDDSQEVRLRLGIDGGTPTIREIAIRRRGASWAVVAANTTPEFRIVTGLRRMAGEQIEPLRSLGMDITPELVDREKWNAFWDAPLNLSGDEPVKRGAIIASPPIEGVANQPGLPRKAEEIKRASAVYRAEGCTVKTNGGRLEVSFPGVELGVFAGALEYTVYRGTNLIRQTVIAKTEEPSVAYKYDAGLTGLALQSASRIVWRDISNLWQDYRFGGANNEAPVPLKASNRLVVAESANGSIVAFPPPHTFFWAREIELNLGYSWYRKDSASSFSFGIRQAEREEDPLSAGRGDLDLRENFALYSARPGTWQRMPVYFYVSPGLGEAASQSALAFTRGDRYKAIPGYQVMATHFHTGLVRRLRQLGGLDAKLPDLELAKGAGVNIFGPIDGGGGGGERLSGLAAYYEAARRHSDKNFLILPEAEIFTGILGGHSDLLPSKPLFWTMDRKEGQPFVEDHSDYGRVYHIGSAADMMEMATRENALTFIPHPRTKQSTGYPDAIKDTAHFRHEHYRGIGVRWGFGLDGSETRLCEYRCQALLDEANNWIADLPTPPKHMLATTETYQKGPGDDFYANNPVNYVRVERLPGPDDWSTVINALKRGDYFWTSGEVLIPSYSVEGTGTSRTVVAEVEWTFPLEFVELVWGDGQKTGRQVIAATDRPPFGRHRFQIPFDATGKKWVRFAVWDSAGNGAMVQPIKLTSGR